MRESSAVKSARYRQNLTPEKREKNRADDHGRYVRYYEKNRERAIAAATQWAEAHPERRREIMRDWYARNKTKASLGQVKYRKEQPLRYLITSGRRRAKKRGIDFSISIDDLTMPTHCPLLGVPIDPFSGNIDFHPSLDRLDNTKGYVPGNVAVVSHRANRIKSDSTHSELLMMAESLARLLEAK